MIRKFQFEAEIYESLSCLPMAPRRKLDAVGIKIGRSQWAQLGRGVRLMICHAPANRADEIASLRLFIEEAVVSATSSRPAELSEDVCRLAACPPSIAPAELCARAKLHGVSLDQSAWSSLDADERYALIKLGCGAKSSHNFDAALNEILGQHER